MSKISFMGAIAKGAIHPAAYVALGNLLHITSNVKGFELSEKLGKLWQGLTFANGRAVLESFGKAVTELDLSSAEVPMKFFRDHSFEMGTAAFWGVTSTLVNRILKETPEIRNYPKIRVMVAAVLGAGTTWATWQFGLNRNLDVRLCTDLALKVGIIGGVWKIATTSVKSLRFLEWAEAPKKVLGIRHPESVEEVEDHFFSHLVNAIHEFVLTHNKPEELFWDIGDTGAFFELVQSPTKAAISAAAGENIHTVTRTLTCYLKEMEPRLLDKIKNKLLKMDSTRLDARTLKNEIDTLDDVDKALLKKLICCLSEIAVNAEKTKKTADDLSMFIIRDLFTPKYDSKDVDHKTEFFAESEHMRSIFIFMIKNYTTIFE